MATAILTGEDLQSRLPANISVQSLQTDTLSAGKSRVQNLPARISITSVPQDSVLLPNIDNISKPENDMWNQFEQFRQWQQSLSDSSPVSKSSSQSISRSSLDKSDISTITRTSNNPLSKLSVSNITRTSRTPLPSRSIASNKVNIAPNSNKSMSYPFNKRKNRLSLSNKPTNILPNITNQTLSQPLNPNVFLPGALKWFFGVGSQIANTKNQRKYPQLSNESMKRQASSFMAAPSPEILAQMRPEGFAKDFQVENCRSSSEYLHCLLGYGLHQTLNFPIMGVFYLELVRLIMKHMDKFSSIEKIKLIQVSNVCEDILKQNSTRDDFLPVDVMDKIIEEAVKEESSIQKMIEDFNGGQDLGKDSSKEKINNSKADISILASQVANDVNQNLDMFSNISVSMVSESKPEELSRRNAKRKSYSDEPIVIDLDTNDTSNFDINSKVYHGITISSKSSSNVEISNKTLPKLQPTKRTSPHLTKPLNLSDDLTTLLGMENGSQISRQEVVKKLWIYVKEKKLQDPKDGRYMIPDKAMETIFGKEKIRGFGMVKFLRGHLT